MTREITYQKEFHDTVSNWKNNRLPAAVLLLGLMLVMLGVVIKPLGVLAVVGFGIVVGLALQQRRLNKKRGFGIFDPNSKSTRNILGWRY
jgi:hypothetical protein